jgi:hypothetical protein
MGALAPIIADQTILGLALPGTHDTLTYDLSLVVSDGGIDGEEGIAEILHLISELNATPTVWPWIDKQVTSFE